jgi:hypothetical protein
METKGLKIKLDQYHFMAWHDNELMFKEGISFESERRLAEKMEMVLNRVYLLGKKDGYLEGLREAK